MIQTIKDILKQTILYDIVKRIREKKGLQDWERRGKIPPTPHLIKQEAVKEYARRFSIRTLVETGTYLGDMIDATKGEFNRIFSIELDKNLYERAKKKFSKFRHISIIQGDSGEVLPKILDDITQPCLFWLDGHYSGGITAKGDSVTPIMLELKYIFGHPSDRHIILIDDARLFIGKDGYPTLEEVRKFVAEIRPGWSFEVKDDIIRIHKKE